MSDNQLQVQSLINGIEFKDSRLATLLQTLATDLYGLQRQINPPVVESVILNPGGNVIVISTPQNFMATVFVDNIRLTWDAVSDAAILYEIRLGSSYATAEILLTTATLSADIDPISRFIITGASYTFWITAQDDNGVKSSPASTVITIPNIGAPTISSTLLQNYILLSWTVPSSAFTIDHYDVFRNGSFYGTAHGSFFAIFEVSAGTYTYAVQAVDIVGNLGSPSPTISVPVNAPSDFVNQGKVTSTFSGTKTNCFKDLDTQLIAPVFSTETWNDHFNINNSFANIQAQINAGYPIYAEPSKNTATYVEVFDFGSIFNSTIVSMNYNFVNVVGSVSVQFGIQVSTDNISYDASVPGTSRFASSVRYAKVTITFTPSPTDKSLIKIFNLTCNLNVHQETDSGTVSALAADAGGTTTTLNKAFHSLNSIQVTPLSTNEKKAVFDFNFATVDPTTFKTLVFDSAGARVNATVAWIVKGVL